MNDAPDAVTFRAPGWFALADRLVAALERLALPPPGLAAAGPLLLVPKGTSLETSMANEIPLGMDGIQRFRPADYDGPILSEVTSANATVAPEPAIEDGFRITLADGVAAMDTVTVKYRADERHGPGEKWSEDDVTYTVVAADAEPLTEAGFDVVPKGEPAPPSV